MTVTRADLEAKAREIKQAVESTRQAFSNSAVMAAVAVVAVVAIAYLLGRRRRKDRAVVEVYRA